MNRRTKRILATVVVLAVGWLAQQAGVDLGALTRGGAGPSSSRFVAPEQTEVAKGSDAARLEAAFARRESGFMVTVEARVVKTLRDDLEGSRHQRFLIELDSGRTLLVAHNIDLASRIDLEKGDAIRVRGQFEWNDRGGVLHWTHRDPDGRHDGGWIEHSGTRVQ